MAYHSIQGYLNSPFGDTTTFTKVFVGGLAWETQSHTLRRHFEPYGDILEAVVITDKNTARSKGYGFVTFRDPEAARRACVDPTPVIDGRRANCNLASLGRPPCLPMQYAVTPFIPGRIRPASPYVGSVQGPRGSLFGSHPYQQPSAYSYQQGVMYPYGIIPEDMWPRSVCFGQARATTPYGPEYMYSQSQGLYGPYTGQPYLQVYGVPGAVNSPGYQYGQLSQNISVGHGYTAVQGYSVPGSHIQSPYPSAVAGPSPTQAYPQYMQSSGSDQTTG